MDLYKRNGNKKVFMFTFSKHALSIGKNIMWYKLKCSERKVGKKFCQKMWEDKLHPLPVHAMKNHGLRKNFKSVSQ